MKFHLPSLRTRVFWLIVVIMAVVCGSQPVLAKETKKTVAKLTTKFEPEIVFETTYVRAIITGLDSKTVDSAKIEIKRKNKLVVDTFNYSVDRRDIASAQPKMGMNEAKSGLIDFRLPVKIVPNSNPKLPPKVTALQEFKKDDIVTLTINYNEDFTKAPMGKYQPKSAVFRTGFIGQSTNENNSKPIPVSGFEYTLDPVYSSFNDLDTLLYGVSGAQFEVRNLQFFSNVDEAFVTGFDLGALLGASYDQGLPHFTLDSSETPGLKSFEDLFDVFNEPDPGRFVVSVGQLYSVADGMVVSTFLHAAQAVPEPPAITLVALALLALALISAAASTRHVRPIKLRLSIGRRIGTTRSRSPTQPLTPNATRSRAACWPKGSSAAIGSAYRRPIGSSCWPHISAPCAPAWSRCRSRSDSRARLSTISFRMPTCARSSTTARVPVCISQPVAFVLDPRAGFFDRPEPAAECKLPFVVQALAREHQHGEAIHGRVDGIPPIV